jgi:hypothetical protein
MTTTANNMTKDASLDDAENGMRQRAGKHPSALKPTNKESSILSEVSKMYDIDGDGKLDASEQAMRDMDTDNRGYLTNEKVYKVMLEQMKLQNEIFGLKRMSLVFVFIMFFLSLATLATSLAAASLAKDTDVKNGILVVKGGDGVIGTSNVAETFTVTAAGPSARRLVVNADASGSFSVNSSSESISLGDAAEVATKCLGGETVYLERLCSDGATDATVYVPICQGTNLIETGAAEPNLSYKYVPLSVVDPLVTISCDRALGAGICSVAFNAATPAACPTEGPVLLGTASNYAILAKAGITTTGTTAIVGDIGVSPIAATAMTGFDFTPGLLSSTSPLITGEAFAANYAVPTPAILTTAVGDMMIAYTDAAGRTPGVGPKLNYQGGLLDEISLTPGVYTFGTDAQITGNIYFRGTADDIFIIQISKNLLVSENFSVILEGGAQANNIFWQVAGYVSVGAGAHMEGTILAATQVTFITGSSINGRVLTMTACALQSATINSAICDAQLCE